MTKVALIGGAGQIAWELAGYLQQHGALETVALCRSDLVAAPLRAAGREVRVFSPEDPASVHRAMQGVQVLIDSSFAPTGKLGNNAHLRRMYQAFLSAPGLRQCIHFSSVAVYGELTARPQVSLAHPQPDSVYGAQKLCTEELLRPIAKQHGVPLLIARLGHVYGEGMAWSAIWNAMLMRGVLEESRLTKPSNAIHIRQLCQGIAAAIEQATSGTWNLVGVPNAPWSEVLGWHRRALRQIDPTLCAAHGVTMPLVRREPASTFRMVRAALKATLQAGKGAIAGSPVMSQYVRLALAKREWLPSPASLKGSLGSPGIDAYFGASQPEEAMYIFDSLSLPEANLSGPQPLGEQDFTAHVAAVAPLLSPGSVREYLAAGLKA